MQSLRTMLILAARRTLIIGLCCSILVGTFPVVSGSAASNNHIISDHDLLDQSSMNAQRVQSFLEHQGGALATYRTEDRGETKTAAQIIVDVSNEVGINPKFFLTMLEKEQGLIRDPSPSQHNLDYALGYGCPSTCSSAYRGFGTQLRSAGARIRDDYLPALNDRGQFNGWGPGITKVTIDGIEVTPANIATAVLYIYNPYVGKYGGGDQRWGANSLFQRLWNQWFVKRHPDGALLRVKNTPGIWLIRNSRRSAFTSRAAFAVNYDAEKVIVVDRDEMANYEIGPPIKFPEPSIIQVKEGGGVYLLANGTKRPISSRETLRMLGYNPEEIIRGVKSKDLEPYPKGQSITENDAYPNGRLLRSKQTGGIVYVDSQNTRHPIFSREIYRSQFRGQTSIPVDGTTIDALPLGDPVLFRDGELIGTKVDGRIYFVSNGQRRPIPSPQVFRQLGFKTKNIIWTSDRAIAIHPVGEPLSDIASTPVVTSQP